MRIGDSARDRAAVQPVVRVGGVYVAADGQLAERWCHAHVMGLTIERAAQLRDRVSSGSRQARGGREMVGDAVVGSVVFRVWFRAAMRRQRCWAASRSACREARETGTSTTAYAATSTASTTDRCMQPTRHQGAIRGPMLTAA